MAEEVVLGPLTLLSRPVHKLHVHVVRARSWVIYKIHAGHFASSRKKMVFSCGSTTPPSKMHLFPHSW